MSKLDEKLTASVKPTGRKAAPAKPTAASTTPAAPAKPPARPAPVAAKKGTRKAVASPTRPSSASDLNASNPPLFPARIWPD